MTKTHQNSMKSSLFSRSRVKYYRSTIHGNEDIGIGLLKKILKDTKISGEEREKIMGY